VPDNSEHGRPCAGALVQDRFEVARRYRLRGTPDAVLIGPDGRIMVGAAGGPAGIRETLATAAPAGRVPPPAEVCSDKRVP
jgi:hypothetical protein